MTKYRTEKDSFGEIKVQDNCYWGAQTQRSLENFKIGIEKNVIRIVIVRGRELFESINVHLPDKTGKMIMSKVLAKHRGPKSERPLEQKG